MHTPSSSEFLETSEASGLTWVEIGQRLGCSVAALWPIRHDQGPLPLKSRRPYIDWRNGLIREEKIKAEPIIVPVPSHLIPDDRELQRIMERLTLHMEHRGTAFFDMLCAPHIERLERQLHLNIAEEYGPVIRAVQDGTAAKILEAHANGQIVYLEGPEKAVEPPPAPERDMAMDVVLLAARNLVQAATMHEHDEGFLVPLKSLRDALKALQPGNERAKLV